MKSNYDLLGNHIQLVDERNGKMLSARVLGINIDKHFMPSVANVIGTDLSKYKLITQGRFACNPMHVGRDESLPVALYTESSPAIVSPAYFMFEITNKSVMNDEFLMMWFRRPEFDRMCWLKTDGSVRGGITWDDICRIEVPVLPYAEQLCIVQRYKAITERIELKRKINDNLEASIQALFDQLFCEAGFSLQDTIIKQGQVPDGWTDSTIKHFASVQTGPFGSQLHNEDYVDAGIPIITVEHMDGKYIAHRNLPLVSREDFERLYKYDLHSGDIVFSRVGSVDRAVMVTCSEEGWLFSGRCLRVRPKLSSMGIYFLWWFNQPVVKQLVVASAVGATMPSINTGILNDIRLILPPKNALIAFCSTAESIMHTVAIRRLRFYKRYDKYVDLLKYRKIEITEDIAAYSGKPVDLVIRDLERAIKLQFIPQGHFGKDQVIFITSDEAYEEYKSKQAVYDRYYRKQLEGRMRMKERTKEMVCIMEKGQEYVDKIHTSNDIIKDKVISQKLYRMENIVATIFHEVDINPAKSSKLGLLLNYYLPTTEKLLTAYIDLDEKMIKGKSLEKAKKDIENSLDTINAAFESILDKFYQEQELDIASDITAMEIMMQQEGLHKEKQ